VSDITCDSINANVEIACNFEISSDKFSLFIVSFLSFNLFRNMKLKEDVKLSCTYPRHEGT
jgi:hypothetical protein